MLGSLLALCDYRPTSKQEKRSWAATRTGDYGTEVAAFNYLLPCPAFIRMIRPLVPPKAAIRPQTPEFAI